MLSEGKVKCGLFLATYKGLKVLEHIISSDNKDKISFVVSFPETNVKDVYFEEIKTVCISEHIKFLEWKEIKDRIESSVISSNTNMILAISWRFLLPVDLKSILPYGLIVIHDSLLPKYRGFAPTPAAIINGDTELGITAIYASEKADEGDIIIQMKYHLDNNQYVQDAINIQAELYGKMAVKLVSDEKYIGCKGVPQDHSQATYSIWRDDRDCHIDFAGTSEQIVNLIRAVSRPYNGAYAYIDGQKIYVDKADVSPDICFVQRFPGKIWSIESGVPVVVCGKGMIKIIEARDEDGNNYVFRSLRKRFE